MPFTEVSDDIEKMRPPEGTALSFNADADVLAGQVVKITSDNSVSPSDADGETVVGVAVQSVSSGDQVMVVGSGGRVLYTAGESISAGEDLASHGDTGEEGQVATAATGDQTIGYALEQAGSQGDTFVGVVDLGSGGQVN